MTHKDATNWTLSYSGVKAMLKSVDHFVHYKTVPSEPTDAMRIGSAFDRYLLEGVEPIVLPDGINRKTNEGKALFASYHEKAKTEKRQVVTSDEFSMLKDMKASVLAHPIAGSMITAPGTVQREFSIPYSPDFGGPKVILHGMMDKYIPATSGRCPYVLELKTCPSADIQEIERAIVNFGYYIQAMMYRFPDLADGVIAEFRLIFVETKAPYGVQVIALDEGWYEKAMADIDLAARRLIAYQSGKLTWTGYSEKTVTISMPNYMGYKMRNAGGTVAPAPRKTSPSAVPPPPGGDGATGASAPAEITPAADTTAAPTSPSEPQPPETTTKPRKERSDKGKPRGPKPLLPPASEETPPPIPEPPLPPACATEGNGGGDSRIGKAFLDKTNSMRVAIWDALLERGAKRWPVEQAFRCEIATAECLIQKPFAEWGQVEIDWFASTNGI